MTWAQDSQVFNETTTTIWRFPQKKTKMKSYLEPKFWQTKITIAKEEL